MWRTTLQQLQATHDQPSLFQGFSPCGQTAIQLLLVQPRLARLGESMPGQSEVAISAQPKERSSDAGTRDAQAIKGVRFTTGGFLPGSLPPAASGQAGTDQTSNR